MSSAADRERRSRNVLCLSVLGLLGLVHVLPDHLRLVVTPSIPRGAYLALAPRKPAWPGDLVAFCLPEDLAQRLLTHHLLLPGRCPGGSGPIVKRVAATSPTVACATPAGLQLGGRLVPWPPPAPPALRLPRYRDCGPIPPGCLFVLGDLSTAVDSRIFGCVPESRLLNRLIPIPGLTES